MEHISLYRKYRPHNFDNLVGQDHIKTTLINSIRSQTVVHAYLFTGPRGTGKTSTARLLAKALCCTNLKDGFEPCDECEFCKDINEGRLIDLIEIDAASNRRIDEVRDLKETINFAPTRAKYKIYIIDEVHMMTNEAFNALLKTLEEPPEHAFFILATTEVHKIPETIISRCQRFNFKRIDKKTLMTRLSIIAQKEDIKAEDEALELISRYVNGGLRDAIGLLEQLTANGKLSHEHVLKILGVTDLNLLSELFDKLMKNQTREALNIVNDLHSQGVDLKQFVHEFVDHLRENLLKATSSDDKALVGRIIELIEVFQESSENLESAIPQLPLEIAVIKVTGGMSRQLKPVSEDNQSTEGNEMKIEEESDINEELEKELVEDFDDVEEVAETKEPIDSPPLTISHLKEKWPRIMERVKRPTLRMSLKDGMPAIVDGVKITLQFNTQFHKDKVIEHDNRVELEEVIKGFFGKGVKIDGMVKKLDIKPVIEEKPVESKATEEKRAVAVASENDDFADQALEIFGGELID